jgi:hypothetical protein
MFYAILLAAVLSATQPQPCEVFERSDGTAVKVCEGHVVAVRSASGEWRPTKPRS